MSKKHEKVSMTLNYIGHFVNLFSVVTGYGSISAFAESKSCEFCNRKLRVLQ